MRRTPLIVATVAAVSFVLLAGVAMAVMAMSMDEWHWRMMGGRGSDPSEEAAVAGVTAVDIEDYAFSPANIVVEAGTTVTWTNYDGAAHTVTSDEGGALDSPLFGRNETFSYMFDEPGAYAYHCSPHPNMRGLVTVRSPETDWQQDSRGATPLLSFARRYSR